MEGVLQIHDSVLLTTGIGVVRYVGKIEGKKGQWLGLELTDGCVGDSDGTWQGRQYFKCQQNKGMFLLAKEIVRKLSPEELITKIIHLTEALSRARSQRHNTMRTMMTDSDRQDLQDSCLERLQKVNQCIENHPQPWEIREISSLMPSNQELNVGFLRSDDD